MTDVSEQSVAEVLSRAADLIEPEGCWIQGTWALDRDGNFVSFDAPEAVRFCAVGAINRAAGLHRDERPADTAMFRPLREAFGAVTGGEWPMGFNDHEGRTQAEVVTALRQAALLAAPRAGEGVNRG